MTVCKYCAAVCGYHYFGCASTKLYRATKPKSRIEWCGNIQVHFPIEMSNK